MAARLPDMARSMSTSASVATLQVRQAMLLEDDCENGMQQH